MSSLQNLVNVIVLERPTGGFDARVTFKDGGGGQSYADTPELALVNATNMAVLDRKYLDDSTAHILALAEGLSPGALRHVSDYFYRLADEARTKQNAVPVPQSS